VASKVKAESVRALEKHHLRKPLESKEIRGGEDGPERSANRGPRIHANLKKKKTTPHTTTPNPKTEPKKKKPKQLERKYSK